MKIFEINSTGELSDKEITRKELIQEFGVHTRDLRPVFSLKQVATLSQRGNGIVINFRSVKLLVGAKKVYIFNTESEKIVQHFTPMLADKIKNSPETRFEFVVMEAAFAFILERISLHFEETDKLARKILDELGKELLDEGLEKLLNIKKKILSLQTVVREIDELINEILDDEEELNDLYLTANHVSDTDEVESILENSLEQVENYAHSIDELSENIDDTQEILTLKMARMRTTIIKFDLIISSFTAIIAVLAVITGLYGMNVPNFFEKNSTAFLLIMSMMLLIFLLFGIGIFVYLKRKKVI